MPDQFAPTWPRTGTLPLVADLTGGPLDQIDSAAVAALPQIAGPRALWRSWRLDGPRRCFLLQADGDAHPLREALAAAGELDPWVDTAEQNPAALARSALLWAATPPAPVTIARVFDSWTPEGGGQFDNDHPILSAGAEPALVQAYLNAGHPLLSAEDLEADIFDPDGEPVVPIGFRTDGRFIWTGAVGYYLRSYALSPDADLLAHIQAQDYRPPAVDAVAVHRALTVLTAGE